MTAVAAAPGGRIPSPVPAPATDAGLQKLYASRIENSYAVSAETADRIQAMVGEHLPMDREFPNPQTIKTVYVRPVEKKPLHDVKFRIRTYPNSPEAPSFLEFKDTVVRDGQKFKEKTRLTVAHDTAARLLWGEPGSAVIDLAGRSDEELAVARRAIRAIDELGIRPVVRQEYVRHTFQDALEGVRITFDRGITFTGIGELARAGTSARTHAIIDVKVTGQAPAWLTRIIDTETASGAMTLLKDGKGATAIKELVERAARFVRA